MAEFSCVVIGEESLLIGCAEHLLNEGHQLRAVVSKDADIRAWAKSRGLPLLDAISDLPERFEKGGFDYLFSIANLSLIGDDVLALPALGAVNFHDGPLPEYAGLNTPVWALINGETRYGITWHRIEPGIDTGAILAERRFDVAGDETAYSLNAKCYAAALESFGELSAQLAEGRVQERAQDLTRRVYYAGNKRPQAAGLIDFSATTQSVLALVRALDFAHYRNPVTRAKLHLGGRVVLVGRAEALEADAATPGTVLKNNGSELKLATADGAVTLSDLSDSAGRKLDVSRLVEVGARMTLPDAASIAAIEADMAEAVRHEPYWRARLAGFQPARLPLADARADEGAMTRIEMPADLARAQKLAVAALFVAQSGGEMQADMAYRAGTPGAFFYPWVPLQPGDAGALDARLAEFASAIEAAANTLLVKGFFARDLIAREPGLDALEMPDIAISEADGPVEGACVTLSLQENGLGLHVDSARLSDASLDLLRARVERLIALVSNNSGTVAEALRPSAAETAMLIEQRNATEADFDADLTIHGAFQAQAARTPEATALVFEGESLSYDALNRRANQLAHELRTQGAGPGVHVALYMRRSLDLLIGALGILKSGAAYVPLDPDYPAERIAHYITDSEARLIVSHGDMAADLPDHDARIVTLEDADGDDSTPDSGATGDDLAYLIYTSGSTGLPKGVMVEHRNVANFFTGMDAEIDRSKGAVWLAVTSLSFDISVLELFYTLARGFKVVLAGDETRAAVSDGKILVSDRPVDFGLYYWGNDDGQGARKYELLLEGAKFADRNGFNAVWTPERHFHAFGGPYPNPSVTGAAVAAVTSNIAVRSGSCVAPLHHPARIAEEWAVIDNLTEGRAGLGFASGWHPDDFVLRPENTPPNNKPAMYEAIDQVRALWRGEAVDFPTKDGGTFAVKTQPRPVSKELPVWVTIAGNPDTWREAGEIGANVLTHLLGQSIQEVGEKIKVYHAALQGAGHDPNDFKVTVMLHTYLAESREEADRVARGPMKDYLRSAAGLIKQYAWAFPAFKKPKGVNNPFELDLRDLGGDEVEAILDFAFERYFEDSGMFGTIEDGIARAEQLKRIGVDEIACLIDYGIPAETVLDGLKPLAEVRQRANAATHIEDDDFSIAAQIIRHGVTHLQCTPSMARLIAMSDEARAALSHVQHLMLGGEALPADLVEDLRGCSKALIHNMYGPTETTIWSTTQAVRDNATGAIAIGRPVANTSVYVLDDALSPVPAGVAGELFIGGEGVTRGYWQRADLTAELFPTDPFRAGGRMYRTGDLVRWNGDGALEFLGRRDHQVKIRGQRIELGEIETCLGRLTGITQAVVLAREFAPGDDRLVAYVTCDTPVSEEAIRAHLEARLPQVMVPAHSVVLDAFPLTPNRKIDRNALPMPQMKKPRPVVQIASVPGSDSEKVIAGVWGRVLGVSHVAATDNFFDLGGHSLLAVQAHREIKALLAHPTLSITDVFRFPVLRDLARHVARDGGDTAPGETAANQAQRTETMSKRRAMRAGRGGRA